MGIKKTLGGDRLGSGNRMAVTLENFGRSSHNVGNLFKTDQAFGTLVPYYLNIGLNGTTFDVNIATKIRTLPTVGPIFGSAKHQIDVFHAPIRLYIAALHNNALGIGMKMQDIKLPAMSLQFNMPDFSDIEEPNSQQIDQSSLLAYIGIRGGGKSVDGNSFTRTFPAIFLLMYWDIYKNYYANKQEEIGYVITPGYANIIRIEICDAGGNPISVAEAPDWTWSETEIMGLEGSEFMRIYTPKEVDTDTKVKELPILLTGEGEPENWQSSPDWDWLISGGNYDTYRQWRVWDVHVDKDKQPGDASAVQDKTAVENDRAGINLTSFELANIDTMREKILAAPKSSAFHVESTNLMPYMATLQNAVVKSGLTKDGNASYFNQVGLGIRTYLSDRFNNWLSTEWIDGVGGVNEISAVDVSDGKLTMDALILAKKIFEMMNRIAISGGSYNDWQEAVYGVKKIRLAESPMYAGGMSAELVFDEVVSNSASETSDGSQPLGSLAGRGAERGHKGGKSIKVKVDEPSMLMVIGSFVPRIDYSQGNKWWNRLETMNDFHKPNLDAIGFQELLTEEFAAADTTVGVDGKITYKSVGKQPSWIEYMTNVNESFGSFASGQELEFMAFNRSYEYNGLGNLEDATTYIDPTKFNVAFADAKLSAKNIWVQAAFDVTARRRMSAKQIPNL